MARIDKDPEDRDTTRLTMTQVLDCPECDTPFDHIFLAPEGVYDTEDLEDPPTETVQCTNPDCLHSWEETYSGWTAHSDAGHVTMKVVYLTAWTGTFSLLTSLLASHLVR